MKKYLPGLAAMLLALTLTAFTREKKSDFYQIYQYQAGSSLEITNPLNWSRISATPDCESGIDVPCYVILPIWMYSNIDEFLAGRSAEQILWDQMVVTRAEVIEH